MLNDINKTSMVQRWMLAARPKTLWAAVSPVLVGCGIAIGAHSFQLGPALAALFAAVMIQMGTNLVNDVVDYGKGADTEGRLGPMRVTQAGLLSPRQVWTGVGVVYSLAVFAGIYLAAVAGWPVLVIGAASLIAGYLYTGGPFPLAYNGLGDLFVMVFFGFVAVCGTAYVTAGFVPPLAWPAAFGVGALTTAILVVNNIRDIESDRKAGRKNIPVVFGRQAGEVEFNLLLAMGYLTPVFLFLGKLASGWVLFPLISIPWGFELAQTVRTAQSGPELNMILAKTAQLLLAYSLLFAFGIATNGFLGG